MRKGSETAAVLEVVRILHSMGRISRHVRRDQVSRDLSNRRGPKTNDRTGSAASRQARRCGYELEAGQKRVVGRLTRDDGDVRWQS